MNRNDIIFTLDRIRHTNFYHAFYVGLVLEHCHEFDATVTEKKRGKNRRKRERQTRRMFVSTKNLRENRLHTFTLMMDEALRTVRFFCGCFYVWLNVGDKTNGIQVRV